MDKASIEHEQLRSHFSALLRAWIDEFNAIRNAAEALGITVELRPIWKTSKDDS